MCTGPSRHFNLRASTGRAQHARYAAWLRALVEAPEPFAVAEIVLASFLQIVTNPKMFRPATPMQTA